jgi:hypothetical protein
MNATASRGLARGVRAFAKRFCAHPPRALDSYVAGSAILLHAVAVMGLTAESWKPGPARIAALSRKRPEVLYVSGYPIHAGKQDLTAHDRDRFMDFFRPAGLAGACRSETKTGRPSRI